MAKKHVIKEEDLQDKLNQLAGQWVDRLEVDPDIGTVTVRKQRSLTYDGFEVVLIVPSLDVLRGI